MHGLFELQVLSIAVDLITRCLDPSEPNTRKALLPSATQALRVPYIVISHVLIICAQR